MPSEGEQRWSLRVSRAVFGVARSAYRVLPGPLRERVEDRFFYAVFNVTRVTNDNYGWRPEEPGGVPPEGPAGEPPDRPAPPAPAAPPDEPEEQP